MALYGYYFNAVNNEGVYDRTYNAEDMCSYLKSLISNGVFEQPSTSLQVIANSNMGVLVKAGSAFVEGHKILIDSDYSLTIPTADTSLNRIDRIVIALNRTERAMQVYIKQGTLASNPVAPTLTRTSNLYELSLATITVNKNTSTITQSMIRDDRGDSTLCGFVHCLVEQADLTTIWNQFDALLTEKETDFDTWFDELQETLVSNTVFIEKKAVVTTSVANQTTVSIPVSLEYGAVLDVLHVYVNGFRLVETVDYNKTTDTISFINPISQIGTQIEITNWKTIGSDDAQSLVATVSDLSSKMANIQKYRYDCTGTNDNTAIMTIINSFIAGSGSFSGVGAYSQLELSVYGRIDLTSISTAVTTTNCDGYFAIENSSNRKVILDLSNAEINVTLTADAGINAIFDIAMPNFTIKNPRINATLSNNNIDIIKTNGDVEGGYINVTNNGANSVDGIVCTSTTTHQTIKDVGVKLYSTSTTSNANNVYGFRSRNSETDNQFEVRFINCSVYNTVANNTHYGLFGFDGWGFYDNCSAYLYNFTTESYGETRGFTGGGSYSNCQAICTGSYWTRAFFGKGRYVNCKGHAATQGTNTAAGFMITGEATNCEGIGRNVATGSGYGFIVVSNGSKLKLVNCRGYGYTGTPGQSVDSAIATGIGTEQGSTSQIIVCIGCECPINARQYLVQKDSIVIFSPDKATLIGNVVHKAIEVKTGATVTESGTIVG